MMGLSLAAIGIMSGVVQGTLIKPIVALIGERRTQIWPACCSGGSALPSMAGNHQPGLLGRDPGDGAVGCRGAATTGDDEPTGHGSEQGQLQGANSSIMALAGLIGPGLFSYVFAHSIARDAAWQLPGAPFLLASAMLLAAAVLAWWVTRPVSASPAT